MTHCDSCSLQNGGRPPSPGDDGVRRLLECDDCPLEHGAPCSPETVALLVGELRQQLRAVRKLEGQLKKARNEARELREEAQRSEERVAKLEELQKASTRAADAELQAKMELLSQKQAAILALSTPIIEVRDGVLVLPLIGVLDDERATALTESLLAEIQQQKTRYAIIDLTGVPAIDRKSAQHILLLSRAVALLGAKALLCGLRPQVAQALVGLGVDLQSTITARSLQEALRQCV
jgi:rsbT co-antagonist protein RsbR